MKSLPVTGLAVAIAMAPGASTAAEPAGVTPTFNKDVAPILFDYCVTCHRPDQIAPMTLMSTRTRVPGRERSKTK